MPEKNARRPVTCVGLGLILSAILLVTTVATGGILDATWTAPTKNIDGSPLTDLASYRLFYGTSSSPCPGSTSVQVAAPTSSFRLTGLITGTRYHAAIVAIDASGNQSPCSNTASAIARADFSVSPTGTVSFGNVSLGTFAERTYTVSNTDGGTLSGSVSVSAPFSVASGSPFTLTGSATQAVRVRFTPTTTTTVSTNVIFTAGGGTVSSIVSGTGIGTALAPTSSLVIGSRVQVVNGAMNVRATAGGTLLGTQPVGAFGRIVGGPQLAAISGSGSTTKYTYWQIDYESGVDGWSGQDNLVLAPPPPVGMTIGSRVQVVKEVINVRATAGGTLLGTQPVGAFGRIVGGPQLAAISGSGNTTKYTYWQIDYGTGVDGWSGQDNLILAPQ
jgi:hypothetical protein